MTDDSYAATPQTVDGLHETCVIPGLHLTAWNSVVCDVLAMPFPSHDYLAGGHTEAVWDALEDFR